MTRDVPAYPATTYRARERQDGPHRAFRNEVLAHVRAKGQLVDVRSPEEYSGERLHMPDYPNEGALRGGHIPGAKSIPWARAINPDDGTFKTADELREIYVEEQALKPPEPTIAYCRIGERSSHTWFVLRYLLGFRTSATTTGRGPSGEPGGGADREVGRRQKTEDRRHDDRCRTSGDAARRARGVRVDQRPGRPRYPADRLRRPVQAGASRRGDAPVSEDSPGSLLRVGGLRLAGAPGRWDGESSLRRGEPVGDLGESTGCRSSRPPCRASRRKKSSRCPPTSSSRSSGRTSRWERGWA